MVRIAAAGFRVYEKATPAQDVAADLPRFSYKTRNGGVYAWKSKAIQKHPCMVFPNTRNSKKDVAFSGDAFLQNNLFTCNGIDLCGYLPLKIGVQLVYIGVLLPVSGERLSF